MLNHRIRKLREDEGGFTLIELLVVILIIGILAAIALPSFLGQQKKGQDAAAMSDVRNGVSQVESCYTTEQDYGNCKTGSTGLTGLAAGVTVASTGATNYKVTRVSSSGVTFNFENTASPQRTCSPASTGACKAGGTW